MIFNKPYKNWINENEKMEFLRKYKILTKKRILDDLPRLRSASSLASGEVERELNESPDVDGVSPSIDEKFMYTHSCYERPRECKIIGYEEEFQNSCTLVIDYGDGPCFILSDYFKEMQSLAKNWRKRNSEK